MSTEVKIIAGLLGIIVFLGALFFGFRAVYDAGDNAGAARVQLQWDDNKAAIQKVTDTAIAAATKERDDAIQANQVLHDQYETHRANDAADTAAFAKRMRDAEARLTAANQRTVPANSAGSGDVSSSQQGSAQQLGQLVTLVAGLRSECKANDDTLDALYASLNKQPHVLN